MGVPNARARISDIKIGGVWKPSSIEAHVPTVDVSSGLRALAEARKAQGAADASASEAWAKGIDSLMSAAKTVISAGSQAYKSLDEQYVKSAMKNQAYKDECLIDPTKYNPDIAKTLAQDEANNLAARNSLGIIKTSSAEITDEMVRNEWLKNLPEDKWETDADDKTFDLRRRIDIPRVTDEKQMLDLYDSAND